MKTPNGYDFSLLSHIDILGMRNYIAGASRSALEELIKETTSCHNMCGLSISSVGQQPWRNVVHFQDSFVAITELGWTDSESEEKKAEIGEWACMMFCLEMENLCNIQMNFIRRHVLMRGAVAVGEAAILGEGRVMGPGWLRVLALEQAAKHPRVIIAPELLGVLDQHPISKSWLEMALTRDDDGTVFVNYLWGSAQCYPSFQDYLDLLREHRNALLTIQQEFQTDEPAQSKLQWVINYHNNEVDRVRPSYAAALKVSP
jgi:hypothetical protein